MVFTSPAVGPSAATTTSTSASAEGTGNLDAAAAATPQAAMPSEGDGAEGDYGECAMTPGRASRRPHLQPQQLPPPTPPQQQRTDVLLERRRVNGAMRRAGLQLTRALSADGSVRFTCIGATEGRLMLEAHRIEMEKRCAGRLVCWTQRGHWAVRTPPC